MSICCCESPRAQEIEFWMPSRLMGPSIWGVNYEVSDKGRVRAINKGGVRGEVGLLHTLIRGRYWTVHNTDGTFMVHHLVADAFIGPRPEGMQINHIDGNRNNNRKENLEYCTHSENTKHAHRTGLIKTLRGERIGNSKLKEDDVLGIKLLGRSLWTHREIADVFSVSPALVGLIIQGKRWAHVQ